MKSTYRIPLNRFSLMLLILVAPLSLPAQGKLSPYAYFGEIRLVAIDFAPRGWAFCEGQKLLLAENEALFSLLGASYGGDGKSNFAIPDLRKAEKAFEVKNNANSDVPALRYIICLSGLYPSRGDGTGLDLDINDDRFTGETMIFAGYLVPAGWMPAEGKELQISKYEDLFDIIRNVIGGDGKTTFKLPDMTALQKELRKIANPKAEDGTLRYLIKASGVHATRY